jgi:hypothetical protein
MYNADKHAQNAQSAILTFILSLRKGTRIMYWLEAIGATNGWFYG